MCKDPAKEYNEYMKDRIITKLCNTNEYELLCYSLFVIELGLRQSEVLNLKWDQIEFTDNEMTIKDVYMTKRSNQIKKDIYCTVTSKNKFLMKKLTEWHDKTENKEKIFCNFKKHEWNRRIGELIGCSDFNSHDLRRIGIYTREILSD